MSVAMASLTITAPAGVPLVQAGDDLAALVINAVKGAGEALRDGDIIVLAQKIVSKAEGRTIALANVTPSDEAIKLAAECDKDPRLVELILSESQAVMRVRKGVLIVRHNLGLVLANAGIDQSNIEHSDDESGAGGKGDMALLLPVDPDASAAAIRQAIAAAQNVDIAVVIIDSLGRAWRKGTCGIAIGVSGMAALLDLKGEPDLHGRPLQTSELGLGDEVAAAASLIMGQAGEGRPVVLIRGATRGQPYGVASDLVREPEMDLFP